MPGPYTTPNLKARALREKLGLAQLEVAMASKTCLSIVSWVENHGYRPKRAKIRQNYAKTLGVPETELWPPEEAEVCPDREALC